MIDNRATERGIAGTYSNVRFLPALLLFILSVVAQISFAQTANEDYPLNDPRNPNCPCHKYQKMADDEYKQQQHDNQTKQFDVVNPERVNTQENNGADNSSHRSNKERGTVSRQVNTGNGISYTKNKKKKPGTWIVKKINRTRLKYSRIKKQHPDYSVCYKW